MTTLKLTLLAAIATLSLTNPASSFAAVARITHICSRKLRPVLRVLLLVWAAGSAGVLGSTETLAQNAYITNADSNNVSVINIATNTVVATIPIGYGPFGVSVSPDGGRVYIGSAGVNTVGVIETATNTVIATIPSGPSAGIAASQDGRRVYAANFYDQSLSVIDTKKNSVIATIPGVGAAPLGVAVANAKVYVADWTAAGAVPSPFTVAVVDTATNKVIATIPIASASNFPLLAASPDGRRVYVTNEIGPDVPIIDTATDTVIGALPLQGTNGAAVSPDGTIVYIAGGNHVNGIDVATDQIVVSSDYVGGVIGISVTPDGRRVYAASPGANVVFAIDTTSGKIIATIPVGSNPFVFGNFIQPRPTFAGTPGKANCYGQSVSALAQQYGGLNNAAAALGYPSVSALQNTILAFCEA
jgi:YVTN family beta-propeller protein